MISLKRNGITGELVEATGVTSQPWRVYQTNQNKHGACILIGPFLIFSSVSLEICYRGSNSVVENCEKN